MNHSSRALLFILPFTLSTPLSTWIPPLLSPLLSIKHANNLINHLARSAYGDSEEEEGVGGGGGVIQTSRSVRVNVSSASCQSVSRLQQLRLWKLLNNRSSEAVGRLWHLSPITVEAPFPCRRPDQPVSHIYDPLSVVTSVEHLSPAAWPSHQHSGFFTSARPLLGPCRRLLGFCF